MLAPEIAWEDELAQDASAITKRTAEMVERERRRGAVIKLEQGAYRRFDGLMYAYEEGFLTNTDLATALAYSRDFYDFYQRYHFTSTLDYQNRVESGLANDFVLSAGLRVAKAERLLTPARRLLVRAVCGEGHRVGEPLMRELQVALRPLNAHYREVWAIERSDLAPMASGVMSLRALAAVAQHQYRLGSGWRIPQIYDVLHIAQGGLCAWCNEPMVRFAMSVDHVIPRAERAYEGPRNLLGMHGQCNAEKADQHPPKWLLDRLRQVNAVLGWCRTEDEDPEDYWRNLTSGLEALPMAAEPRHFPVVSNVKGLGMTAREWARRKVALERTLARLERLKNEPAPIVRRKYAPLPVVVAESAQEADWSQLLPAKPSRSDDTMAQSWLAEAGVVKSNRDMRHLGVQAKAALKVKAKANGRKRKRVRRRGRS